MAVIAIDGPEIKVGDRVQVATANHELGVVQFIGKTSQGSGEWLGVALDQPRGNSNGSIKDKEYFTCKPGHGLFVRRAACFLEDTPKRKEALSRLAMASEEHDLEQIAEILNDYTAHDLFLGDLENAQKVFIGDMQRALSQEVEDLSLAVVGVADKIFDIGSRVAAADADAATFELVFEAGDTPLGFSVNSMPPGPLHVDRVVEGTVAAARGVSPQDEILVVDGEKVESMTPDSFKNALRRRPLRLLMRKPGAKRRWESSDEQFCGLAALIQDGLNPNF